MLTGGWPGALYVDDQRIAVSDQTNVPPQMLETVCTAMADVFGLPSIEPDADFFHLGGHSLTATRVASRLSTALKVTIPIRLIFEAPTPNDLATKIASEFESLKREHDGTPIVGNEISVLTPSQRRMWFLHITDPASSAYNVGGELGLQGEFDATIAVAAFRMCLEAHPILRATYATKNGLPVQRIGSAHDIELGGIVRDFRGAEDSEARINDEVTRLTKLPFDLSSGPLYRFRVFQVSDDSHVLAVSFHHIVVDGWAVGILIRDLFKYYAQLRGGSHLDEAPAIENIPTVQPVSPAKLNSQLDYWKTTLMGAQDSLDLPVDYGTPRTGVSEGSLCKIPLAPALLNGLQDVAKDHRSTLFIVMLAGFQVLLARYSRQRDFLIGVPVANRNQKETENVIASMVNTLPYRADMNDDPTLPELLARVRNAVLDMQDNQDAPLEAILDSMDRTGATGSSPFRVMFDYQEIPLPQNDSLVFNTEKWETHRGAAQFDLVLFVSDINGDYFAALEYRPSRFDASTIEQMSNHFISILHCMVQAHSIHQNDTVFTTPLLSREERQRVLTSSNDTALALAPGENLLHDFSRQVVLHASAVAISSTDGELTYAQVDQASNRIARHLQAEGIGRGDSVAVYLERSAEMVSVLLGILKSAACYVPLDPEYPAERIAMILEEAAPRAAVTQSHIAGNIVGTPTFLLDDEKLRTKLQSYSDAPVENTISPDDLAYIIFTSGSTGRPKGVEIPHRGLHNFLHSMAAEPGLAHGDTLLAVTTISFDISGLEMFLPLLCGARVHIARRGEALDGHHLINTLESIDVTHLQATPATWNLLLTCGWKGKQSGRPLKMLCGGEELLRELATQLIACGGELWNLYGPTETTIWSTARRITSADSISIGRPIGNTQCYVLDDHFEPVPTGVSGELFIGGHGVAAGYHKRPELTAERFVLDPFANNGARLYRTGDLARYDSSGELQFLGRLDHQVKIRGHRIELGEIATALDSHPSVRRSVVTATELPGLGKSLVAYCEPGDSNIATNSLLDHVRKVLPAYMVPTAIVIMDALPLTPNGKIDRKQLPLPQAYTSTDYAAPKNELERRMTEIWADLLKLPKVGTNDDFFALGGHSLLAAQAFIRMKEELGLDLPLNALFDRATVSALAERWEHGRSEKNDLPDGVERLHEPAQETNESSVTLLWVHPLGGGGGGGLLSYREMAKGLPTVRSFGIREAGEKFDTLEEMAHKYAERLCQTVPTGSVALAGFCFGGNLALEVAR
ncbi:MAG: amino acid adenylation domain-containing protein, partial [Verrucomicrobia bacterium]|nr:amino acid adenylation domain-containing protein [Verrucomicrobiota bacterium]